LVVEVLAVLAQLLAKHFPHQQVAAEEHLLQTTMEMRVLQTQVEVVVAHALTKILLHTQVAQAVLATHELRIGVNHG
jgi:hypothetical protein